MQRPFAFRRQDGTNVLDFAGAGDGDALAMFNAATAHAIAHNAWPIVIPPGDYTLGDGTATWWVNDGASNTGLPIDCPSIIGSATPGLSTPEGGVTIRGVIAVGSGPNAIIDGNKISPAAKFVSPSAYIRGLRIFGRLELRCLQNNSLFEKIHITPTTTGERECGMYLFGCNTATILACRVSQAAGLLHGIMIDTCSALVMLQVAVSSCKKGIYILRELDYTLDPNPDGKNGSNQSVIYALGLHLEGNHEESAYLANMADGIVQGNIASNEMDPGVPLIQVGHATDSAQASKRVMIGGRIGGYETDDDDSEDTPGDSGTIGVKCGHVTNVVFQKDLRFRRLDTDVYVTDDCGAIDGLDNIRGSGGKRANVVGETVGGSTIFSSNVGGYKIYPTNRKDVANEVALIKATDDGPQFQLTQFSDDSSPALTRVVKARGNPLTPSAVVQNDTLMTLQARGYGNSAQSVAAGSLNFLAISSTPTVTDMAGKFQLLATKPNEAAGSEVMSFAWANGLKLWNVTPAFLTADQLLSLTAFTLATLPTASSHSGQIAVVSDGASNKWLVRSDGTNWRYTDGATI